MAPIRVLFINHVSFLSGAERSLLELISAMGDEVVAPFLACPPGELATRAREIGVEVISLPLTPFRRTHNPLTIGSYALTWMAGRNQVRKIVNSVRPQVIHANSATAQVYAAAAAKKAHVPCVWHSRDLRPLPYPANTICREAEQVVAISQCVADFLHANGFSANRIATIHNGIDAQKWRESVTGRNVRTELGLAEDDRVLLMAAQFAPWKRHEDAISAMEHILQRVPAARLVLAGSDLWEAHPDLDAHLRAHARALGLGDKVIFAGQCDHISDLMSTAEMLLMPSDAEPFGRVAIEAMALGKPVVGTRAGGLPEVVSDGKTGLLVVPRFPESLADACLRLLENTSLASRLGEAARERVEATFGSQKMANAVVALYEKLTAPSLKWIPA